MLGHSQGGLLLRNVLQLVDGLKVANFVSMAGIQQGYYGTAVLEHILPNVTERALTRILYTRELQDSLSVANWWHSPFESNVVSAQSTPGCLGVSYLADNDYLPSLNNIRANNVTAAYKTNFVANVDHLYLFGSPQDGTVVPWISELFGFFGPNDLSTLIEMEDTPEYVDDTFGLRTLDALGRLHRTAVPGIEHSQWLHNKTNFMAHIAPLLY
ncbi:uncharacterized protein AMSG_11603 [Thecamonas trahens ATCC 50062]|uniref:Lysosomal thioesterase PPT2 n=1 Tax=Thecamonas trahens ATCC 50062 TaxID=461836 RepID=A0A0L0D8N3_THETB|nr:hypothetical protein AMSG_11603 [Thecamonas trahens ATCC 50062]KNC48709.1 hypothetical protein AMSG_11603 [Thecamonas trahens ATCC 50062]|eukprot:XP_013762874.1 hypothetical protein AMSG_11603 [Thecamonas trahens ATCC 50062]